METSSTLHCYKRGIGGVVDGGGPPEKRRKMDSSLTQHCSSLLKTLMKHSSAVRVFNAKALKIYGKSLAENWDHQEDLKAGVERIVSAQLTDVNGSRKSSKIKLDHNSFLPKKSNPSKENVVKVPTNAATIEGELPDVDPSRKRSKIQLNQNRFLPKQSKPSNSKEKVVKVPKNEGATEDKFPKVAQNSVSKLARKNLQKDTSSGRVGGERANGSINAKPPLSQGACKRSSCSRIKRQRSPPSDSIDASSKAATSKRSLGLGGDPRVSSAAGASKLDGQPKTKSKPDSNGAATALNENKLCQISHPATPTIDATSGGLLPAPKFDVQMSPKKALRVAMLKSRFADAILKAQQTMQPVLSDKADLVKMQREKLERWQEEKAKIEAQITAEEAASKIKAQVELKKKREAARIALQKMENTAGIEVNLDIQREFDALIGCRNPPYKLGLSEYLKDKEDEAVLYEDLEEGEILS